MSTKIVVDFLNCSPPPRRLKPAATYPVPTPQTESLRLPTLPLSLKPLLMGKLFPLFPEVFSYFEQSCALTEILDGGSNAL